MKRVALLLLLAAIVCGSGGAQSAPTDCCPYLRSFPQEWTAEGSRLFFWSNLAARQEGIERRDLFVVNADGTGMARVLSERPDGEYLRTPDGRRVAFLAHDGVLYSIDGNGIEQGVIAKDVSMDGSVSPDGRRYAHSDELSQDFAFIRVIELPGGQTRAIGPGFYPAFSPDGSKIAAVDDYANHVYDAETGREIWASSHYDNAQRPVFSPDGTHAAFSAVSKARRDDTDYLYVVDLRTGESSEIGAGSAVESWSPNGSRFAYRGPLGVETIRSDGTGRRRFLDQIYYFRFSSDWTRYAFAVNGPLLGNDLYIGITGRGLPQRVSPSQCTIVSEICLAGGSGDDRLEGGPRREIIVGGLGNDRIAGGKGNDLLDGELGRDIVSGGPGKDELYGNSGADRLRGGSGPDTLRGGTGADTLEGGDGRDALYGNPGPDVISGGKGADLIVADRYDDRDRISCGAGFDRVRADRTDRVAPDCERVRFRQDP